MEELEFYIEASQETMEGAIKHLNIELSKIRAGKASTAMLEGIMIDYYGMPTPLTGASSITTPDARTIAIKPFEKGIFGEIEKAIRNSNLGLNPMNDGELIRLSIPPLTEERRRDLVKRVKQEIEVAKINVRNGEIHASVANTQKYASLSVTCSMRNVAMVAISAPRSTKRPRRSALLASMVTCKLTVSG